MSQPPESVRFSQRLRAARLERDLDQQEVADALEVSLATYGKWERMVTQPKAVEIGRLARLLDVSADYLLGLTDHPQGLRVGTLIVDQHALERFRLAPRAEDAAKVINRSKSFLSFANKVPEGARVITPEQYRELLRSLIPVFRRHGLTPPKEVNDESSAG